MAAYYTEENGIFVVYEIEFQLSQVVLFLSCVRTACKATPTAIMISYHIFLLSV